MAQGEKPMDLMEIAQGFLILAREQMALGYDLEDDRRVRAAAEDAWLAAVQALDHVMRRHGQIPEPGPMREASRQRFLEKAGRKDLSDRLSVFHDQLHGRIYYLGDIPGRNSMGFALEEVDQFIRTIDGEL